MTFNKEHPELFPEAIEQGYRFYGLVSSLRQGIRTRRIYLPSTHEAYQIRSDFVTPYMSETAEVAGKALYLKEHGLSYEGIAHVLGRSEMHWVNLFQALGRVSIVGSTVKRETSLPPSSGRRETQSLVETADLLGGDGYPGLSIG